MSYKGIIESISSSSRYVTYDRNSSKGDHFFIVVPNCVVGHNDIFPEFEIVNWDPDDTNMQPPSANVVELMLINRIDRKPTLYLCRGIDTILKQHNVRICNQFTRRVLANKLRVVFTYDVTSYCLTPHDNHYDVRMDKLCSFADAVVGLRMTSPSKLSGVTIGSSNVQQKTFAEAVNSIHSWSCAASVVTEACSRSRMRRCGKNMRDVLILKSMKFDFMHIAFFLY
jgi:hypothetical protein